MDIDISLSVSVCMAVCCSVCSSINICLSLILSIYMSIYLLCDRNMELNISFTALQTCNITNYTLPLTNSLNFHVASHFDLFLDYVGDVYITGVGRFDRLRWLIFRL